MKETGAQLAGEMSGHIFFKERWYGFDDGIYAAARLLEILASDASTSPSAVLDALPDGVSTPELKVPMRRRRAARVRRALFKREGEVRRRAPVDDRRPARRLADGFGLVRASNTTPVLVLRFEGDTQEALARIQDGVPRTVARGAAGPRRCRSDAAAACARQPPVAGGCAAGRRGGLLPAPSGPSRFRDSASGPVEFFVEARALHALLREQALATAQFGVLRADVLARDRRDRTCRRVRLRPPAAAARPGSGAGRRRRARRPSAIRSSSRMRSEKRFAQVVFGRIRLGHRHLAAEAGFVVFGARLLGGGGRVGGGAFLRRQRALRHRRCGGRSR